MMQRVITDNAVKLLVERTLFDIVHFKGAAQSSFMIDIVRDARDSLTRHLNKFGADVDAFDDVAEAGEVFAQPTGSASHIKNPAPGGQRQCHGDIREVTEVPESLGVHSVACMFDWLVDEIVKRF